MKKINIIQFLPFFPPHKWWLETVAEELSIFYVAKKYGEVINIVYDIGQNIEYRTHNGWLDIIKNNFDKVIWYRQKNYIVYLLPAFEVISNFPFPKFWKKEFWDILKETGLKIKRDRSQDVTIIQTHTRFFTSSFLWWLFAKYNKLKWVHIEHWSDYVKLWSNIKSKVAYVYDRLIWKWIFKNTDKIVAISEWVKNYIINEFINTDIEVIYNWINFKSWVKQDNSNLIKIWFVWRLVKLKWIDLLLEGFKNITEKYTNLELYILWDWDEKESLEKYVLTNNFKKIFFLWFKDREYIANDFLPNIDILVNPSFQEWLPTTVLEWLLSKCVVIATDVWWTREISDFDDLIIINKWSVESIEIWLVNAINNYKKVSGLSYKIVKEKFDWNVNIDKYYNLYQKVQ